MRAPSFRCIFPIASLFISIVTASADTQWIGPLGGSWFDSSNWSDGLPGISADVLIDSGIAIVPANASTAGASHVIVGVTNTSPGTLLGVSANQLGSIYLTIGRDPGSSGLISFTQAATALNVGSTIVGDAGTGVLTLEGSSVYSLRRLSVGAQPGSTGTIVVNGSGSGVRLFELNSDFESFADIGVGGTGVVEVKSGASFAESGADLYLTLGTETGGNGRITASGAGSIVDAYDIQAGVRSQGTLQIQSGALLTARTISLGSGVDGVGTLSLSGAGAQAIASTLRVGSASGRGSVVVESGALLRSTNLLIGSGLSEAPSLVEVKAAEIQATALRSVDGQAATIRLKPAGVINADELDLNLQTRLEFQLGESSGKIIAGDISFAGLFVVELTEGYVPQIGATFDLFDFTLSSGQFDSYLLAPLPAGFSWDTSSLLTTGELRVVPEPQTMLLLVCGVALMVLSNLRRHRSRG